jgi:hypothetical protein
MPSYAPLAAKWATPPAVGTRAGVVANLARHNAMTAPAATQPVAIIDVERLI